MSETWAGDDDWADSIELLLDGEIYTKATFQDGEFKPIMNRTTWLRARLAMIFGASGDGDVDAAGRGDPVDSFTTTAYEDATAIQVTATGLLAGDIVVLDGSVLVAGDASSSALLRLHDGTAGVPGWRFAVDVGGGIPDGGSSDGAVLVVIRARYVVAADGDLTFTLQGRKIGGGDDGFSTYEPWNLTARVYRP